MTIRIAIHDPRASTDDEALFRASPVRLGRSPLNDLVLEDPRISQWHAQIVFDTANTWFVDVGSRNGSLVDGMLAPAHQPVRVSPRTTIEMGSLILRVQQTTGSAGVSRLSMMGQLTGDVLTMLNTLDAQSAKPPPPEPVSQVHHYRAAIGNLLPLRQRYVDALNQQLAAVPDSLRASLLQEISHQIPELGAIPELASFHRGMPQSSAPAVDQWAHALTGQILLGPDGRPVSAPRVLARVAALMQTFAQCLSELRQVKQQVAHEFGLGPANEPRVSAAEILAYLMDFRVDGEERVQALAREYAELAVHQLALVSATRAGVRELVDQMAPKTIEENEKRVASGGISALMGIGAARLWDVYRRVHEELVENERFSRIVFGAKFAHAYLSATGRADAGPGSRSSIEASRG